jgi:hypothetical protein
MFTSKHPDAAALTRTLNELAKRPEMAPVAEALAALQNQLVAKLEAREADGAAMDYEELESFVHGELDEIQRLALDGLKTQHAAVRRSSAKGRRSG